MIDIEKAQRHYSNLAAFAADVKMWFQTAASDDAPGLAAVGSKAAGLVKKWRSILAEVCLRERVRDSEPLSTPTRAPAKARGKGRVEVLTEEEDG